MGAANLSHIAPPPSQRTEEGLQQEWYAMLAHIGSKAGFNPGWAAHQFKDKFGMFPSFDRDIRPKPPSPEVKAWVKERRAAYLATKKASDQATIPGERTA
jgi:hypothetical protein